MRANAKSDSATYTKFQKKHFTVEHPGDLRVKDHIIAKVPC